MSCNRDVQINEIFPPVSHLWDLEDDGLGSLAAGADVDVHVSVLVLHLDGASPVALK